MCKNGQNVSWTSVCDGRKHCKDGSDEQSCKFFERKFSPDDYIILNLYSMSYNALEQGFFSCLFKMSFFLFWAELVKDSYENGFFSLFIQFVLLFVGFCQGDVYTCLAGNNVSCRFACEAYGRVTCLTYTNTRACEQYFRERMMINHRYDLLFISWLWCFR